MLLPTKVANAPSSGVRRSRGPDRQAPWWAALSLIWPISCPGCGVPDVAACRECLRLLSGPVLRPVVGGASGLGFWSAATYSGSTSRLILAWKERGRHDLTSAFAGALASTLLACRAASNEPAGDWLVVPVPTRRAAARRRGGDLVAVRFLGWPMCCATVGMSGIRVICRHRPEDRIWRVRLPSARACDFLCDNVDVSLSMMWSPPGPPRWRRLGH